MEYVLSRLVDDTNFYDRHIFASLVFCHALTGRLKTTNNVYNVRLAATGPSL